MRHDLSFRVMTAALISSAVVAIASPAHAQAPGPGPVPPHAGRPFGMLSMPGPMPFLPALALTEAQEDQIFRIFHEQAPAVREHMRTARRARQQAEELLHAPTFDRTRARELAEAEARAMADLMLMRLDAMRAMREVLTPEQRTRLDAMARDRGPRLPPF